MTPEALADYLYRHIPLARAMDVSVEEASAERVTVVAPLPPNINVHGTMFGGSAAVLGCWPPGLCCICDWRPRASPTNW